MCPYFRMDCNCIFTGVKFGDLLETYLGRVLLSLVLNQITRVQMAVGQLFVYLLLSLYAINAKLLSYHTLQAIQTPLSGN